jgi:hypothetical protein
VPSSVLALPVGIARAGRTIVRQLIRPITGPAALIRQTLQRSTREVTARPEPASVAAPPPATPSVAPPTAAPAEPEVVVDPVPLSEPARDLDVQVMLPSDLPIRSYDALAAPDAIRAIHDLTDVEEVRAVLRFEEENAKRPDVLAAGGGQVAKLAGTAAAPTTPTGSQP